MRVSQAEGAMTGIVQSMPTTLNEHQISRLFKCAVKDDETLIDTIVERLYGKMKEFDGRRADQTVGLKVDRDATGGATLRAFLDEVSCLTAADEPPHSRVHFPFLTRCCRTTRPGPTPKARTVDTLISASHLLGILLSMPLTYQFMLRICSLLRRSPPLHSTVLPF
jgi:hypothetical protein